MTIIVADSSVWIDYLRDAHTPETAFLDRSMLANDSADTLIVLDVVLYEVLSGVRDDATWQRVDSLMRRFTVVPVGGEEAAISSAARYRELRRRGITIRKSMDVLIASWCLDANATLLHRDRDFVPFTTVFGLRTV